MAFFPPNYGDSKIYNTSHNNTQDDEVEDLSLTWHDAAEDLEDLHKTERIKDIANHSEYLKREKAFKNKMKEKARYMEDNSEKLLRNNPGPGINIPLQSEPSRAQNPSIYRPGIGLLGKGEENDYDVYDTEFHGGKKKHIRRSKKTKRSKRSRKTKKTKKNKTSKKTRKSTR